MKTVYFLKPVGFDGPIKIGCSVRPAQRLRDVQIWSPFFLEIITTAEGGHDEENHLHHMFAASRRHGEWFDATPELVALIEGVKASGRLPSLPVPRNVLEWRDWFAREKGRFPKRGKSEERAA